MQIPLIGSVVISRNDRRAVLALCLMLTMLCAAAPPATGPSTKPSGAPTTRLTKEQQVEQLFAYLVNEYSKRQFPSRDWMTRSVATISIAQMPTADATKAILDRLSKETHPVGRLIAWQALLSRAALLTDAQFAQWQQLTARMGREQLFQGDLRVGWLRMLSSTPITTENRRLVQDLFNNTNSLDSTDVPTLVAMGRAIREWGDGALVESLISVLSDRNQAIRAKLVLKAAGVEVMYSADAAALEKWWKENKANFIKNKPAANARKSLGAQYIDPPVDASTVDPDEPRWRQQLELGALGLRDLDFAITIDCSRSMTAAIDRLKHDLLIMFAAFNEVAQQPRIGITGFATAGQTRTFLKLTGQKNELVEGVKTVSVFGVVGEEEWAGGIDVTIKGSEWRPTNEKSRRVIVLITDEPMTPDQQVKAIPIVKKAAQDGFRLYVVAVLPLLNPADPLSIPRDGREVVLEPPLPARRGGSARGARGVAGPAQVFEDLAALTGGQAIISRVPDGALGLGALPTNTPTRRGGPVTTIDPNAIAPVYANGGPTTHLLSVVLADAINPQYAQRMAPLVQILAAHSQRVAWIPEMRNK